MTDVATPARSAAVTLREHTADDHKRAEQSEFQRQFVSGRLSRAGSVGWLEQMWFVYGALARNFAGSPYAAIFAGGRDRTPEIERDLESFAIPAATRRAVAATNAFIARIDAWAASDPAALLGALYVLEGSTNGSKYIARAVRKAYALGDAAGTAFLDPYGEKQMERWQGFRAELDAAVSAEEHDALVAAAGETFNAVRVMGEELLARAKLQSVSR